MATPSARGNTKLPSAPVRGDTAAITADERVTPTIPKSHKRQRAMLGAGMHGHESTNPDYRHAAVHERAPKRAKKKILPGDELLDAILKHKKSASMTGKGVGMRGRGYQFEGDWIGDDWQMQALNRRRQLALRCYEPMTGTGTKHSIPWLESMKTNINSTIVPALIRFKGLDDLSGRRKVGSGAGWKAHFDADADALRATTMSPAHIDKFCRNVAATVVDYVNDERHRHNASPIDKQQRYRIGRALLAYIYKREHAPSAITDEYFWKEVLPYILTGKLVSWGYLKTGGGLPC